MPGAWELQQHESVICGILHVDGVCMAWAKGLRELQIPGPLMPVAGYPFDHARNVICQQALDSGVSAVFFLDSDVVPPPDAIHRLLATKRPIISGIYARRSPPHAIPVMMRGGQWVQHYPANTIIDVDVVGAGCLLIRREVLEHMGKHAPIGAHRGKAWFDWRVDLQSILPPGHAMSEDFSFCLHARTLGYKVNVDTSIICRHIGLAEATPGRFVPCAV